MEYKMKSLLTIALLTASVSSFATVFSTQSFSKIFYASSEAELVEQVEAAIPSIEAGEDKELSRSMRFQRCSPIHPRHIKIGKLFIKKIYSKENGTLTPKLKGTLVVSHNRCFEGRH